MRPLPPLPVLLLASCARLDPVPLPGPPDAGLHTMNLAVQYCGFQPSEEDAAAILYAMPGRTDEGAAVAICMAVERRALIRRGFILPEVDGIPVRGRFVR